MLSHSLLTIPACLPSLALLTWRGAESTRTSCGCRGSWGPACMPWCCAGHNRRYCRICTAVGPCAVLTARSGEGMGKCCRSGCPAAHNKRMGTHASRYGFSFWILSGHSQSHVLRGTHLSRAHLHLCPVHVELIREDVLHGDERMSLGRAALIDGQSVELGSYQEGARHITWAHDICNVLTFMSVCCIAA